MRISFLAISMIIGVAGAAWSQPIKPAVVDDGRFQAEWEKKPGGGAFKKYFPRSALNAGIVGAADVCCTPLPDRTLACTVGFEWPTGYGFGEAGVNIAKDFQMSASSYQELNPLPLIGCKSQFDS